MRVISQLNTTVHFTVNERKRPEKDPRYHVLLKHMQYARPRV